MPESTDLSVPNPVATHHVLLDRDKLVAGLGRNIREIALEYAGRGWRVIPVRPKGKAPLLKDWPKQASCDPGLVRARFSNPAANIGVAMGRASGVWTLDIDPPNGPANLAKLEALHGSLPHTLMMRTGRGGVQYFFKYPARREIPNKVSPQALGHNIDVRGQSGQSVVPPSIHPNGKQYVWLNDIEPAEAPSWLLDLVCSKPSPPSAEAPRGLLVASCAAHGEPEKPRVVFAPVQLSAWAQAAFEREIEELSQALQGRRNAMLNTASFSLGQIVAGGALDGHEVEQTLLSTARAIGLSKDEARATIASGLEAGRRNPRSGPKAAAGMGADAGQGSAASDKPTLLVQPGALVRLADEAEAVLIAAEVPVYQRGGQLVRIAQLPEPCSEGGVQREAGSTIIKEVSANWMLDCLGRLVRFFKPGRKGGLVPVDPDQALAKALLSRAGSWNFNALRGILSGPCLRADGTIINVVGYDECSGYYLGESLALDVPEHPTRADAEKCMALLLGLLAEFPFASEVDKAVALALLLTPLARPAVGRMPLLLVSAPVRGSGKSTLVRLAAVLATGRAAPVIAATASGDELEKRLVASLLAGDSLILLDNFNGTLRSDLLSQAVTEGVLRIRRLGVSEQVEVVSDSVWVANGNGLTIGGDLSRRTLRCTLDPRVERPELRRFECDPVHEAQSRRSEFVSAALTVMKAFIVSGRPGAGDLPPWAGFESWSGLMRGALVWLGLPDPLASADQLQADDPDREILADLLAAWKDCLGSVEMTARELLALYTGGTAESTSLGAVLAEIVGRDMHGGESRRLGRWLTANSARVVDGLRLERAGTSGGVSRWRVRAVEVL